MPDLDPEPVPAHGFRPRPQPRHADPSDSTDFTDFSASSDSSDSSDLLPRRHRGRTLAEAEAAVEAAVEADATRIRTPASQETSRPTSDDVMNHAARFNSFRQAVRRPSADEPEQARTSPASPHPEGGPTS